MQLFWIPLALVLVSLLAFAGLTFWLYTRIKRRYLESIVRIFVEKPLFVIPKGRPVEDAEDVRITSPDGLTLRGCYLPTTASGRRGVILFGLEYGSNRWACVPYTQHLRAAGYDIFTFEPRSQGTSDPQPGYEPLQWVTDFEVEDFQTALSYLKARPDADPRGVGFFGISKGGSAGLIAAARDPFVRCFLTDGIFATHATMLPYMRKWVTIYSDRMWVQKYLPNWMYSAVARACLKRVRKERGVHFPHLERAIGRLSPRPLFMIHGGADTYIKPDMAQALYERASEPREFWVVEGAKHNQAMHVANGEYQRRVLDFFNMHLAGGVSSSSSSDSDTSATHPERRELARAK